MRTKAYINGKWVGKGKTFAVFDPFSGKQIAKVPDLGKADNDYCELKAVSFGK